MINKKEARILLAGAALFLFFSFALFTVAKTHCDIDSKAYIERALAMYNHHSFMVTPGEHLPYYALGYSLFLSFVYGVVGNSVGGIVCAQVLLALLCGLILFFTARTLFGQPVALLTFLLFCTNIGVITFAQFILTETLLATFLLLFFACFTAFLQKFSYWSLSLAGLCLGHSIIVKPAALLYVICLFPLFLCCRQEVSWGKKFSWVLLFIVCMASPVVCYMGHNKATFGVFSLGSLGKVNLYFWLLPNVLAQVHGTTSDHERVILQKLDGGYASFERVERLFKETLIHYPHAFLMVWGKNVAKTLLGLFTSNLRLLVDDHVRGGDVSFFKYSGTLLQKIVKYLDGGAACWWLFYIAFAEMVWTILRWIFVFIALGSLFVQRQWVWLYFIGSYISYFSMIAGHDGCARFRLMFEFVLIVLVACGIVLIYEWFLRWRQHA